MSPLRYFMIPAFVLTAALPAQAQVPATVTITLSSYSFAPNPIRLRAGQSVRLYFDNQSGKGHNFTAPSFFAAARILAGSVHDGMVDLKGHQSASVELIPAAGKYKVHCSHFMHTMLGMKAAIVVQ